MNFLVYKLKSRIKITGNKLTVLLSQVAVIFAMLLVISFAQHHQELPHYAPVPLQHHHGEVEVEEYHHVSVSLCKSQRQYPLHRNNETELSSVATKLTGRCSDRISAGTPAVALRGFPVSSKKCCDYATITSFQIFSIHHSFSSLSMGAT